MDKFHVEEQELNKELKVFLIENGESDNARKGFLYGLFNRLISDITFKCKGQNLPLLLQPVYLKMWEFLVKVGENGSHILKLKLHCDLVQANSSDYRVLAMIIGSKCCPECDMIDGMAIPIEEALLQQPLPHPICEKETGCVCCYVFVGERDMDNNLIMK
jgi:hypothetical protein